jgi:hypothetical protein
VVAFEQQLKAPARLVFFDGSATNGQGIQPCGTTQHCAGKAKWISLTNDLRSL